MNTHKTVLKLYCAPESLRGLVKRQSSICGISDSVCLRKVQESAFLTVLLIWGSSFENVDLG